MKKKVAVISWDAVAAKRHTIQTAEFFGDEIEVESYSVQDGSISCLRKADLYLVSTCAFHEYKDVNEFLPWGGDVVILQLTITKESFYRLLEIPRNTSALLVNINPRMATETIAYLNKIGVNNITFYPCYPGVEEIPPCNLAITPGETQLVPTHIKNVIDIGNRELSLETILEAALKLRMEHILNTRRYRDYAARVVDNDFNVRRLYQRSIQFQGLYEILQTVVDMGVIGVDDEGLVFTFNKKAEDVMRLKAKDVIYQKASAVFPCLPFREIIETRRNLNSRIIKIHDVDINVSITPVMRNDTFIGAFALVQKFSEAEYKQYQMRRQLMSKGHISKYTFADIAGNSPAIVKARVIAQQMAKSNGTVLLTGESGTGKELFAHAIHAASDRAEYPFVGVNCAAIPEDLLESELFGYEEGAFTGARKGGKTGYFEFAHQGTLFLDEIEGMSHLLQLKLLRVIQEKEVMRVGGSQIIYVDVRIIAATNENLFELAVKGAFRKDLYYRLAALPVELPPLRERGEDTLLLFENLKQRIGANFELSPEAKNTFFRHTWDGNIRELRNCVEYLACLEKQQIEAGDLPRNIRDPRAVPLDTGEKTCYENLLRIAGKRLDDYLYVLQKLLSAYRNTERLGRKTLAEMARLDGRFLSEQEIRTITTQLGNLDMVQVGRGRSGSKITETGISILSLLQ
jgi:transcriptional regulator with PAS, ATPase and Fis domain